MPRFTDECVLVPVECNTARRKLCSAYGYTHRILVSLGLLSSLETVLFKVNLLLLYIPIEHI